MSTPPTGPSGPAGPGPGRHAIAAPDLLAEADLLTACGLLAWALQLIDGDDLHRLSAAFHIERALRELSKIPARRDHETAAAVGALAIATTDGPVSSDAGDPPVPGVGFTNPLAKGLPRFEIGTARVYDALPRRSV